MGRCCWAGNFTTVGGFASPGVARLDTTGANESEDVVTISANLPKVGYGESTNIALVTVHSGRGNLSQPVTVFYTTAGAAVSGVDYQPLSGHADDQGGRGECVVQRHCQSAGGHDIDGAAGEDRVTRGHGVHGGQRAAVREDQDRALIWSAAARRRFPSFPSCT